MCTVGLLFVCEYRNGSSDRGMERDLIGMSLKLKCFRICRSMLAGSWRRGKGWSLLTDKNARHVTPPDAMVAEGWRF